MIHHDKPSCITRLNFLTWTVNIYDIRPNVFGVPKICGASLWRLKCLCPSASTAYYAIKCIYKNITRKHVCRLCLISWFSSNYICARVAFRLYDVDTTKNVSKLGFKLMLGQTWRAIGWSVCMEPLGLNLGELKLS